MANPIRKLWNGFRLLVNHINDRQFLHWAIKHRKNLNQFENRHWGEKCFVIGNGPSLNLMDLSQLAGFPSFGLNKIYLHPSFSEIAIDYHVTVNSLVIQQSREELRNLHCPSFISYLGSDNRLRGDDDWFFLMTRGGPYGFSPTPYESMYEGGTVTYVALQLAYFMGFHEVYLIGVDHSFVAEGKPNEKAVLQGQDPNHFHPDYFAGQEWNLPDLEASEIVYRMAKYYYENHGRKIFDATLNGKLEVFPKISFETALKNLTSS